MDVFIFQPGILNMVENVAHQQGINNFKITGAQSLEKEGFLSEIYVTVIKDIDSNKQLDLVIKACFSDEKNKSSTATIHCGENEVFFYSKIYQTFKNFQENKGIKDDIAYIPKCYETLCDDRQQLLCLENLRAADFEIFNKKASLDHDHVSFIFKTYGCFHAYSYALRDQQPLVFKELCKGLHNIGLEFLEDESIEWAKNLQKFVEFAHCQLIPGEDDRIMKEFGKYLGEKCVQTYREIVTEQSGSFAIIHGDSWTNNMMFKYTETANGKIVANLKIIDLQICKLGSPVCDLSYLLYSSGCKEIFDNLEMYLKIYYKSLSSQIRKLGSDSEEVFPFYKLKEHWRMYAIFGVFMATIVIKVKMTQKTSYSGDYGYDGLVQSVMNSTFDEKLYQKKIRELLSHALDIGIL